MVFGMYCMLFGIHRFFIILGSVMVFAFDFLVYCIGALEYYPCVCFPEETGNFPNLGTAVSECGPFFCVGCLSLDFFVHV
jgi:hypothetical protein